MPAELRKFTPVLELANPLDLKGHPEDTEFDAQLEQLEDLEALVARNPRRTVEVEQMRVLVAVVQQRIKEAIEAKLGDAWRQKEAGQPEAADALAGWLSSVTKSVDDKYRAVYSATLDIIKGESGADDALHRVRQRQQETASKKPQHCKLAEGEQGATPVQCTRDQVELICHAAIVFPRVTAFMKRFTTKSGGLGLKPSGLGLKRNTRIAEKIMLRPGQGEGNAEQIFDVVRNMYVASTLREVAETVDDMCTCTAVEVVRIKDRFSTPSDGGWSDCMINYVLRDDPHQHVCELQISHRSLVAQREQLKAHAIYGRTRNAPELLEKLQGTGS